MTDQLADLSVCSLTVGMRAHQARPMTCGDDVNSAQSGSGSAIALHRTPNSAPSPAALHSHQPSGQRPPTLASSTFALSSTKRFLISW